MVDQKRDKQGRFVKPNQGRFGQVGAGLAAGHKWAKDKGVYSGAAKVGRSGVKLAAGGVALGVGAAKFGKKAYKGTAAVAEAVTPSTAQFGILLTIILYVLDLVLKFDGINVGGMGFAFLGDILRLVITSGFVLGIIVFYWLFTQPSGKELGVFAFLTIVLATIIALGGIGGSGYLHLGIIILLYFTVITQLEQNRIKANLLVAILLFFDFIGHGLVEYYFPGAILANRLIVPIWFYYTLVLSKGVEKSFVTSFVIFLVIMVNILALSTSITNYRELAAGGIQQLEEEKVTEGLGYFQSAWRNTRESFSQMGDGIVCSTKPNYIDCVNRRRIERLCTYDFKPGTKEYAACVEGELKKGTAGAKKDKDVISTKVEFSEKKIGDIQKGFNPAVEAEVKIDAEKPIDIEFSCKFKTGKKEVLGKVTPEKVEEIVGFGKDIDIQCEAQEDYEVGRYKVTFGATIKGIETKTTLKRVIVSGELTEERKRELMRLHEVDEREVALSDDDFASFAINVGGTSSLLFVSDQPSQKLTGNIINIGEGKIQKVTDITIKIPEDIHPRQDCTKKFSLAAKGLKITQDGLNLLANIKTLEKGKTGTQLIGCSLDIGSSYTDPLHEAKRRDFFSYLTYDYKIEKELSFNVVSG